MKKRLLSLILCIYLLVSPVLELSAFGTEPEAPAAEAEVTAPVETDTLQWMSYNNFLSEEDLRAWDYPSMFVGSEAFFNVDRYDNFRLAPDPEYIRNLAEAALAQEAAEIAATNAAVMGEGAVEEAGEEAASEEAALPMLPEETDGASSGGSESEEIPASEIISEPAVMEDALTEPVSDEQPAAAEDEAAEGEEPEDGSESTEGEDAGYVYIDRENVLDENGSSIRVVITDCLFIDFPDESELLTCGVWYRVEAAEGYTLPEALANNPYVQNLAFCGDIPSLLIDTPLMGMFVGETAILQKEAVGAARQLEYPTANAPVFFPVEYLYSDGLTWYDLGDISAWSFEGVELGGITVPQNYHYVAESSVAPIPAVVLLAYEKLLDAENKADFESIQATIPQGVLDLFPTQFKEAVEAHHQELIAKETVTLNTSVDYNGIALPVSVKGKIPADAVLSVAPVTAEQVAAEGFGVSATDIVTALDIKIFNADGTEWQPADGELVELTIGMSQLGVADGSVFKLHHKHDGEIITNDVFIVMDGCLTIYTGGFSIYVVDRVGSNSTNGKRINNNGTDTLYIGDRIYYYFSTSGNIGSWTVTDPDGAIYYVVHSPNTNTENIGSNRVTCRWIEIVALKETTTPITLQYKYVNNNNITTETFSLNVTPPKAAANKTKLYIKDTVNTTGKIEAALANDQGIDIADGLAGAAFEWTRSDGWYISPNAYSSEDGYKSVNIARDHGGLTEARKTDGVYTPITYTVKAILADGSTQEAKYTVYYQSEILNASFEAPNSRDSNYAFFPNGWPGLYWEASAPGSSASTLTQDIEYGDVTNGNRDNFGVTRAADYDNGGTQFAELNAENFGSLYQDIITAPGEDIDWDFSHAARTAFSWQGNNAFSNAMYLVIGPTEKAQQLTTQAQLNALGNLAKQQGGADFTSGKNPVTVEYNGANYTVWYHDAGTSRITNNNSNIHYDEAHNYGWTKLEGRYTVPENQYRTRLFFISDPTGSNNQNAGNLIDTARAGQYKKYLIEYYEQTYEGTNVVNKRMNFDESGEALIYSNVKLENYNYFIETENDHLYMVLINGKSYPYDIRYAGDASLYIEKYGPVTNTVDYDTTRTSAADYDYPYDQYDIVMQVFLRDTVVAVMKELDLPDTLTQEQKLKIIDDLTKNGGAGYQAHFSLDSVTEGYTYSEQDTASITRRDPAGNYKGYIALGENPGLNKTYQITETGTTEIPGLKLSNVTIGVQRYSMGQPQDTNPIPEDYDETKIDAGTPLISKPFRLEDKIKIADVTVVNSYEEKEITVYYKAIGKGKIKLDQTDAQYEDMPSETLLFYSGKSIGCTVDTGKGATFVGWYKDEACTQPVTAADGVFDRTTGSFKPNANVINRDTATFYALFETFTVSIERTNGEPGKTYMYNVVCTPADGSAPFTMQVSVTCDANGYGKTDILEAPEGTYTATELNTWSWRHTETNAETGQILPDPTKSDTLTEAKKQITLPFNSGIKIAQWLDGFSNPNKNVHGTAE